VVKDRKLVRIYKNKEASDEYIEVNLFYEIGGMNYFTGKTIKRGYYIDAMPVQRDETGMWKEYKLFSGIMDMVAEAKRFSVSTFQSLVASVDMGIYDSHINELLDLTARKNGLKLENFERKGLVLVNE